MATGTKEAIVNESGSHYCKLPDGTLIQFVNVMVENGRYVYTHTWDIPFINASYSATVAARDNGTDYAVATQTATQIQIGRTPNTADNIYDVIAIGRWK